MWRDVVYFHRYKFEAMGGWQKEKSDQVYQLMKALVERNASIDYVASQTHISLDCKLCRSYPALDRSFGNRPAGV